MQKFMNFTAIVLVNLFFVFMMGGVLAVLNNFVMVKQYGAPHLDLLQGTALVGIVHIITLVTRLSAPKDEK